MSTTYPESNHSPFKPVDEMSLEECSKYLCNKADGNVQSCLACETKCKFGLRIYDLLNSTGENMINTPAEPESIIQTKPADGIELSYHERLSLAKRIKHFVAIASGNPKKWFEEHAVSPTSAHDNMAVNIKEFRGVTPEFAKLELSQYTEEEINKYIEISMNHAKNVRNNTVKRKIIKDIDVQTMLNMREQDGLTNREIAQRLDINYATVIKYIGKQPDMLRAEPGRYFKPSEYKAPAPTNYPAAAALQTIDTDYWETSETIYNLKGKYAAYTVNSTKGEVEIIDKDGDPIHILEKDELLKFIDELTRVSVLLS